MTIYDHDGNPVTASDVLDEQELADYHESRRHRARRNWRANLPTPRPITDPLPVEHDNDEWTPALAAAVAKLRRIGGERP